LLQRVATRLSLRKVKKEEGVKEKVDVKEVEKKEGVKEKEESDVLKNGQQESGLHNDTKVGVGKEPANEAPTDGGKVTEKGKKKKAKDAKKKDDNGKENVNDMKEKEEGEEGVMQRLKSRLSMRGKKKDKVASDQQKECNGTNEDADKEEKAEKKEKKKDVEEEPVVEEKKWVSGSKEKDAKKVEQEKEEEKGKETEKEETKKSDNAFLRMLRKLSFRKKKKKKGNAENESGVEEGNKGDKELEKTLDEGNNGNKGNNGDKSGEKRFEERETRPQSLVMSSGRPPTGPGRPPIHPRTTTTPSSATASVSRPVSDLDSALRQFKLSTAESRESLRTLGSRQDLTQVEERVREAVGKNLSRQGSLRRGAGGSTSIPITLSVSLQELRANQ